MDKAAQAGMSQWKARQAQRGFEKSLSRIGGGYGANAFARSSEGRKARTQGMMNVIDRTSDQQYEDIRYGARGRSAAIGQRLARIGMGNTTVGSSLRAGVEREKNQELNRARDYQQQARLGVLGQSAGFAEADAARQTQYDTQLATARIGALSQFASSQTSASPALLKAKTLWQAASAKGRLTPTRFNLRM